VPLLMQIGLQFSPMEAGLIMIPIAFAALLTKRFVSPLIERFGYRNVLVTNTLLVGAAIASFAFVNDSQPAWLRVIQLLLLGTVNSLQFTAMNTIALKDLNREQASSGNGLLSVVQMLSMSLGVAIAGALLSTYSVVLNVDPSQSLRAFQATFITVGLMTCASAFIFWQLSSDIRRTQTEEEPVEVG
jgi:MFS family permease